VTGEFLAATEIAALVDDRTLEIRASNDTPASFWCGKPLLFVDETLVFIAETDGSPVVVETERPEAVDRLRNAYRPAFENAVPVPVRVPPPAEVWQAAEDHLASDTVSDLRTTLESTEAVPTAGAGGIVELCLVLAARREEPASSVHQFLEDAGIATRLLCRRHLQRLENAGLVDIDDVGSGANGAKTRLQISHPRLTTAPLSEVSAIVGESRLHDGA
jgi:hypothetical protein